MSPLIFERPGGTPPGRFRIYERPGGARRGAFACPDPARRGPRSLAHGRPAAVQVAGPSACPGRSPALGWPRSREPIRFRPASEAAHATFLELPGADLRVLSPRRL